LFGQAFVDMDPLTRVVRTQVGQDVTNVAADDATFLLLLEQFAQRRDVVLLVVYQSAYISA